MTTLPNNRTIASLTKKSDILKLPGFEDLVSCSVTELKEYVKKRVAIYSKNASMKTHGFTVRDYMENYKKDPKSYKPFRNKAIENLKNDINQIADNAKKAKDDLKEFEADKVIEKEDEKKKKREQEEARRAKLSEEERKKEDEEKERERKESKRKWDEKIAALKAKKAEQEEAEFQAIRRINLEAQQREQAERDRKWEEDIKKRQELWRQQQSEAEKRYYQKLAMEAINELREDIERYGKNSQEVVNRLEHIRDYYGEYVYYDVVEQMKLR